MDKTVEEAIIALNSLGGNTAREAHDVFCRNLLKLIALGPGEVPDIKSYRAALVHAFAYYFWSWDPRAVAYLEPLNDAIERWGDAEFLDIEILCELVDFLYFAIWAFSGSSTDQCQRAVRPMRAASVAFARHAGYRAFLIPETNAPLRVVWLAMFADGGPMSVSLRHSAPALRKRDFELIVYAWNLTDTVFLDFLRSEGIAVCLLSRSSKTDVIAAIEARACLDKPAIVISDMNNAVPTALFSRRMAPVQIFLQAGMPAWPVLHLDAVFNSFGFDPAIAGWGRARMLGFNPPWDLKELNPPGLRSEIKAERAALPDDCLLIGSYGRMIKVTEPYLRAAERILFRCSGVELVLGGTGDAAHIESFIAASPVGARMHVVSRFVPGHSWGALLHLFLDTWPVSGGESCREVIAKYKPVVTLHSDEMPALDAQRDPMLVARDWDEYVNRAVALLTDPLEYLIARGRARNLAQRMSDTASFVATLGQDIALVLRDARARQTESVTGIVQINDKADAADARDEFDAATIPGMRGRLAESYASYRAAESKFITEIGPNTNGATYVYYDRDCPGCGAAPPAFSILRTTFIDLVECPGCGLTYSRQVMNAVADATRYRASDLDAAVIQLHCSEPYVQLESTRARYYLDRLEMAGTNHGSLLEIGCGTGTLLCEAIAKGWDAVGLEPGAAASAVARNRGGYVIEGYFPEDLPKDSGPFDAVAVLDVLEHIADPCEFLRQIRRCLASKGRLFVQVPNWDSLLVRLEGAASSIVCPGHWTYFTPRTLRTMLHQAGFRTLLTETVVSEIDRIKAFSQSECEAVIAQLRPELSDKPKLMTPAVLHSLNLGYKLIGIFELDPRLDSFENATQD